MVRTRIAASPTVSLNVGHHALTAIEAIGAGFAALPSDEALPGIDAAL